MVVRESEAAVSIPSSAIDLLCDFAQAAWFFWSSVSFLWCFPYQRSKRFGLSLLAHHPWSRCGAVGCLNRCRVCIAAISVLGCSQFCQGSKQAFVFSAKGQNWDEGGRVTNMNILNVCFLCSAKARPWLCRGSGCQTGCATPSERPGENSALGARILHCNAAGLGRQWSCAGLLRLWEVWSINILLKPI